MKMSGGAIDKSLLVLMEVKVGEDYDVRRELAWIRQDYGVVCQIHATCDWRVRVLASNSAAMDSIERHRGKLLPPSVRLHAVELSSGEKIDNMALVRDSLDEMGKYDLVLLKDPRQRIAGFPWRSFLDANGDALVAGPLRGIFDDGFFWARNDREWTAGRGMRFKLHDSNHFIGSGGVKWTSKIFEQVRPIKVPTLERYFLLMDARFAYYFFNKILGFDRALSRANSEYESDLPWHHLMCQAARQWSRSVGNSSTGPGCHFVPVV